MALTQAQERARARGYTRQIKSRLKAVDTQLEVMERRLDRILENRRLVTVDTFESFLENLDKFFRLIRELEDAVVLVMSVLRIIS